jgi:hypothetical protein
LFNGVFFRTTQILKQCGPSLTLQILKDAANRQGLSALLATPSDNHSQPLTHFPATSNPSLTSSSSPFLKNLSSQNRLLSQNNVQHELIQPERSTHHPNLFYPKHNLQSTDSIRSANQKQSLRDRNLSAASSLIFRKDIPPYQNGCSTENHRIKTISRTKSAIAPKTLPKPIIRTRAASMKPPKPVGINHSVKK